LEHTSPINFDTVVTETLQKNMLNTKEGAEKQLHELEKEDKEKEKQEIEKNNDLNMSRYKDAFNNTLKEIMEGGPVNEQ